MAKKKQQKEEFVEVELQLPSFLQKKIWYQWRYSNAYHDGVPFDAYRESFIQNAVEVKNWLRSPKTIIAGTDGSIRIEAV